MHFLAFLATPLFLAHLITKVIAALGFSVFAFVGVDMGLDALNVQLNSYLSGFPVTAKLLLDMAGVTTIVFWIVQAYALKATFSAGRSFFGRSNSASN